MIQISHPGASPQPPMADEPIDLSIYDRAYGHLRGFLPPVRHGRAVAITSIVERERETRPVLRVYLQRQIDRCYPHPGDVRVVRDTRGGQWVVEQADRRPRHPGIPGMEWAEDPPVWFIADEFSDYDLAIRCARQLLPGARVCVIGGAS